MALFLGNNLLGLFLQFFDKVLQLVILSFDFVLQNMVSTMLKKKNSYPEGMCSSSFNCSLACCAQAHERIGARSNSVLK